MVITKTHHSLKMKSTLCFFVILKFVFGIRHKISLTNDDRKNFPLSTFGFYKGDSLIIDMKRFAASNNLLNYPTASFGFSLQSTKNDGVSSYMEKTLNECILNDEALKDSDLKVIKMIFKFNSSTIDIKRYGDAGFKQLPIRILVNETEIVTTISEWLYSHRAIIPSMYGECEENATVANKLPLNRISKNAYSARIEINITCDSQEGLYNLFFHNCQNYAHPGETAVDLDINMIEHNNGNFLSAGDMPLPIIYGFMSSCFFFSAFLWTFYLHLHRQWTYKIHWLMAAVVYIKSLSVAFHALSYYYVGRDGLHITTWAVLYYILHLLKGALLFTAIILIGTGYFFIKHVFSSKEKKFFMILIPLQVILNVVDIINESTEEGAKEYKYLSQAFVLMDLLCCGAILLPVVWSIKHLTEAAKTDGKAAISLRKLKLFRQFYVMVVCYIYFTRIIVYLIKITVPFQFIWLNQFFTEAATYCFYVLTGYKFRPENNNPYLHIPQDDEDEPDIEMNTISAHSSFGERLVRVNKLDTQARET